MIDVTVSIVIYEKIRDLLEGCLESIYQNNLNKGDYEIYGK